jgi:hypothetical protein
MKVNRVLIMFLMPATFYLCQACINSESETENDAGSGIVAEGKQEAIPVIFETDLTLDVDDVGALAVLHGMQTEGHVKLLGVCYNEVHPLAPDAIDAINTYYNRGEIPIGIYRKDLIEPDPSDYYSLGYDFDVDDMVHDPFDNMVTDAVALYKHLLKNQADNSVVIISVGFLNNLHDLLLDTEGLELVKTKVRLLAVMGGLHNDGFNFVRHELAKQTEYVLENWPGPLVTTHVGGDMITGETLTSSTPVNNPVRRAFELEWHQGPDVGRSSWDEVTTLYAIFGTKFFTEEWEGAGSLKNGYSWNFSRGHRGYAAPKNNKEVEDEIERLMTLAPSSL